MESNPKKPPPEKLPIHNFLQYLPQIMGGGVFLTLLVHNDVRLTADR